VKKRKHKQNLHNLRSLTIEITDLSRSGAGVGHDENGRAIFVPFSAPGDTVEVKLTKAKAKFAEASIIKVIRPSSQRVKPHCTAFTACGGCQWQHIPYELQWQTKLKGVQDSLQLNKVIAPENWDTFPAGHLWHYRNRVQLRGDETGIGFFAPQSNTLVPVESCEIADQLINTALPELRIEAKNKGKKFKVELSTEPNGNVTKTWNQQHGAAGFRQVNDKQNNNLRDWVQNNVEKDVAILDLFGGSGNLSKALVHTTSQIHCIDVNVPEAADDLPENFQFHQSSVMDWLKISVPKTPDEEPNQAVKWIAIIDPPRGGLAGDLTDTLKYLKKWKISEIILVGCKTDPWSRDIARMLEQGWKLSKVAVFDFFPQTYHVETVALLTRQIKK